MHANTRDMQIQRLFVNQERSLRDNARASLSHIKNHI